MLRPVRKLAAATTLTLIAATGPAAAIVSAQVMPRGWPTLDSLRTGDTVRVWSSAPRLVRVVALLDRVERDTLALRDLPPRRLFPGGAAVAVPALEYLEVRRGYRRSAGWAMAGVVLGLAGGAVVGALTGVALECGSSCSDNDNEYAGLAGVFLGGTVGALAGGVAGGIIGARRRPRWRPVMLPAR